MKSFYFLLFLSAVLQVISCSSNSETPHLDDFILGKWQGRSEAASLSQNSKTGNKPHCMEFLEGGKILWDMITQDKTLRFAGDYKFIDDNTIKVDFIRYSNRSAIWEIACSGSSAPRESITIKDCNLNEVIATMERIY